MINKPQLVIFDMDGTMLDTESLLLQGMEVVAKNQNIVLPIDFVYKMIGRNRAHARKLAKDELGDAFDFDKGMKDYHLFKENHYAAHGIPVKKGLFNLLDTLEKLNIEKCVATSTDKKAAESKLERTNILHRFKVVVGGDEVTESKPNPEIFLKAAALSGFKPEECIIIEDSPAGCLGAKNAGIKCILVPDVAPLNETDKSNAFVVKNCLDEVAEYIMGISS